MSQASDTNAGNNEGDQAASGGRPDGGPDPDPSTGVRVAWANDAADVARVQVAAWRSGYADILPAEALDELDEAAFAEQWAASMSRPADARYRVLVAGEPVVGFAATGPGVDPDSDSVADGEIHAFHIDPAATRRGHGSRLLQACTDTLVADRFTRAVIWVMATDDALRQFLTSAGWGADGAHRELDLYGDERVRVKQVRLHCGLAEHVGSEG